MIITLCGSARFEKEFKSMNKLLSLRGHIVHTLPCYPSDEGGKDWYTHAQKAILDKVYQQKIDNSDAILVLNIDGYVGERCKKEILYAFSKNKRVFFQSIQLHKDDEINEAQQMSENLEILMKGVREMDPDSNLEEQLSLTEWLEEHQLDLSQTNLQTEAYRLAELIAALHGWLIQGGALPKAWRRDGDRD